MSGIVVSVLFLEHFNKDKRSYKNFGQVLRKTCVQHSYEAENLRSKAIGQKIFNFNDFEGHKENFV